MSVNSIKKITPGLLFSLAIGLIAFLAAMYVPFLKKVGSTTLALLAGVAAAHLLPFASSITKEGVIYAEKRVLPLAIILMGFSINFSHIAEVGAKGALIVLVTITVSIFAALFLGNLFRFGGNIPFLVGMGNGVCGTSAVVASAKTVGADEAEEGAVIPVINLLGIVGLALIPFIVSALSFSQESGGIVAGSTLQAVGQATAAAFAIGEEAGKYGVMTKMFRVTLLGPILILASFLIQLKRKGNSGEKIRLTQLIPSFLLFFLLASLANTLLTLPHFFMKGVAFLAHWTLLTAMAAIGLKIHLKTLLGQGVKVLSLSLAVWCIQTIAVLFLTAVLFR